MKVLALVGSLFAAATAFAADWPQWRGPEFNGSSSEAGLPSKWTPQDALWTLDMPGPSASTPVIMGDRVFTSTIDSTTQTLHALCIDRASGKIVWNKKTGDGIRRDDRSNYSSPSPVADKDRAYFFYGNGAFVAFDHSGKEVWNRNIQTDYGDFAFQWTFSSSPLLHNGVLYLQILQRNTPVHGKGKEGGESFILALDPANGKTLWKHVRPSEAVAESLESFSTPVPFTHGGREEIIVTGGDCITGHDPKTGAEYWRWGTWNPTKIGHWRLVPSPVAGNGVALACGPKGSPVYAVKLGQKGTLNESALAWTTQETREVSTDVSTPLFYKNDFYILNSDRRNISRLDSATGKIKWTTELPGRKKYETSPTGADGKLYMMNFGGEVVVVDAEKGDILSTIPMGDQGDDMIRSSIPVAHGNIFIRTNKKLYCIGQKR